MPAKRKGRPASPRLSRQRILATALVLYRKLGVERTSLRALAAALRVDPMALYHYFPGKQQLLVAALELAFERLPAEMPPHFTGKKAVTFLLTEYLTLAARNRTLTLYLITRQDAMPRNLDHFNALLLAALGAVAPDAATGRRLRDILIDYAHGYLIATEHFTGEQRRRAVHEFSLSVSLILQAEAP